MLESFWPNLRTSSGKHGLPREEVWAQTLSSNLRQRTVWTKKGSSLTAKTSRCSSRMSIDSIEKCFELEMQCRPACRSPGDPLQHFGFSREQRFFCPKTYEMILVSYFDRCSLCFHRKTFDPKVMMSAGAARSSETHERPTVLVITGPIARD